MRDGKSVGNVKTSETSAKDLARMIVGRDVLLRVDKTDAEPSEIVLDVKNLSVNGRNGSAVNHVSFTVRAGEIVGIAGIEGNGQTELIEALSGLAEPNAGSADFAGKAFVSVRDFTAPTLRSLVIWMLIVFAIIDVAAALSSKMIAVPIISLLLRSVFYGFLTQVIKRRYVIACYVLIALCSLSIVSGLYTIFAGGAWNFASIALFCLQLAFQIPIIVLTLKAVNEFRNPSRSENDGLDSREIKEMGVAHIPEDRHKRGLLMQSSLAENSILGVHYRPPVETAGFMNNAVINKRVTEIIKNFDVRPPNPTLPAKSLSGGNQQKLIIGREFDLKPKLLLVSQPTRGVDIGAIEFIHRKLIGLRDAGSAVLLVSAELEEVTALADRLLVIKEGKIVGEVDPKTTSTEDIGLMMTGGE